MADTTPDHLGPTADERNPFGWLRRIWPARAILKKKSIHPDLLAPEMFPPTDPGQPPGYHEEAAEQAQENGEQPTVARGDHNHDLTYGREAQQRTKGTADADYVDPVTSHDEGLAAPFDEPQRRAVTWVWDANYPVTPGPTNVYARFSIDAGVTWSDWLLVGVAKPLDTALVYMAPRTYDFSDTANVSAQYMIQPVLHDRGVKLKVVRTDEGGKIDANFAPSALRPLVYADASMPAGNTVANTGTETAFATGYTIPANRLLVGTAVRVRARGVFSTDAVAPTLMLNIYIGSQILAGTPAHAVLGGITNKGWGIECDGIVTLLGATGGIHPHGLAHVSLTPDDSDVMTLSKVSPLVIDTTGTLAISVKVTWGTADVDNTISLHTLTVELVDLAP